MNRLNLAVLELKRLKKAGIDAWIAGGAVRDMLTGSPPRDVDLVIRTDERTLRSLYNRMHRVGRKHPVFLIFPWNEPVEVTLLQSDIQTDLMRRDFTWNAMALDAEERLIDPSGGAEDLHQRRLTAPGDAVEKIKDDPVRILRAVRFSLQFDGDITADLFRAMEEQAPLLKTTAYERIVQELGRTPFSCWNTMQWERYFMLTSVVSFPVAEDNDLRHGLINRPEQFQEREKWVVLPGRFPPYWFQALSRKQKKQHTDAWCAYRSLPWSRWDVFQLGLPAVTSAKSLAVLLGEDAPVIPELPIYHVRETALAAETIQAVPEADRGLAVKSAARAVVEEKIPNHEADVHRFLRREGWIL